MNKKINNKDNYGIKYNIKHEKFINNINDFNINKVKNYYNNKKNNKSILKFKFIKSKCKSNSKNKKYWKNNFILDNSLTKYSNRSNNLIYTNISNPIPIIDKYHLKNLKTKIIEKKCKNKLIIDNIKIYFKLFIQKYNIKILKKFEKTFQEIWLDHLKDKEETIKFIYRKESNKIFNYFKNYIKVEIEWYLFKYNNDIYNNILIKFKLENNDILKTLNHNHNGNLILNYKELLLENYLLNQKKNEIKLESNFNKLKFIKNYKNNFISISKTQLEEFKMSLITNSEFITKFLLKYKNNYKNKI